MRASREVIECASAALPWALVCESPASTDGPKTPRLVDRVRAEMRRRNYSRRTEKSYIGWMRRFYLFHGRRNVLDLGRTEISSFLTHLAVSEKVSASTQNQALSALLFLYRDVLHQEIEWIDSIVRAKRPIRLPVVLSHQEVWALLARVDGVAWLMASLLYGAGLRLLECCRLRIKDVDFVRKEILVRDGKGQKDRVTLLPARLAEPLAAHVERVRRQHASDIRAGRGTVELPTALERKYPQAAREWGWQWLFPATRFYQVSKRWRRHHLHESVLQKAVREAARRAGIGGNLPHVAPFVCNPSARERLRHSDDS